MDNDRKVLINGAVMIQNDKIVTTLFGPENSLKKNKPKLRIPLVIYIDKENQAAKIIVNEKELLLEVGEWSPWIGISFKILGPLHTVKGICRFYLKSIDPFLNSFRFFAI